MATTEELVCPENRFLFRGKIYKFFSYIPISSIEMVDKDGEKFSFGVNSPISKEFILCPNDSAKARGSPRRLQLLVSHCISIFLNLTVHSLMNRNNSKHQFPV